MALDHDFYIGDLGFNLAVSKDHPYERATAQFRKDQVDQQSTVGDQSLTGWWTRGQLSFHKGAGIKYYEVLEGETVLNRFADCDYVDASEPGAVTLAPRLDAISLAVTDGVAAPSGGGGGVYTLVDSTSAVVRVIGTAQTSVATSNTAFPSSICTSGSAYYAACATKIDKCDFAPTLPASSTALITLTGGYSWKKVFWAKGRIWAVDDAGHWYALPGSTTATVSTTDAFWSSGITGYVKWSLAGGPGPVYISDGTSVYTVTVDSSGLVPTLSAPTTVLEMPAGEVIGSMTYYLGRLILLTSKGLRVVLTSQDQVLLGPVVVEGDFQNTPKVGLQGTLVYAVGRDVPGHAAGHATLCVVDLSQETSDGVPGWAPRVAFSGISTTPQSGAAIDYAGRLYVWTGGGLYGASTGSLASSGYMQTALHRLGTLESKVFRRALVRVGGTGGTVAVSWVSMDGSITSTGVTINAPGSAAVELSAGTAESIGLRFDLSPDGTDPLKGPVLLGYQIQALPAPTRQRMIRVPLMLFDSEQNRTGQKTGGDPVARRAALEALEESSAVVTFTDKVSGESGTAYIEAVEVSQTTPAGRGKPGGLLYVTLRKLS